MGQAFYLSGFSNSLLSTKMSCSAKYPFAIPPLLDNITMFKTDAKVIEFTN